MMLSKPWYESKTIWFNAVVMALSAIIYMLEGASGGAIDLGIPPEMVALALGIANLILRFVTVEAVTVGQTDEGDE